MRLFDLSYDFKYLMKHQNTERFKANYFLYIYTGMW